MFTWGNLLRADLSGLSLSQAIALHWVMGRAAAWLEGLQGCAHRTALGALPIAESIRKAQPGYQKRQNAAVLGCSSGAGGLQPCVGCGWGAQEGWRQGAQQWGSSGVMC